MFEDMINDVLETVFPESFPTETELDDFWDWAYDNMSDWSEGVRAEAMVEHYIDEVQDVPLGKSDEEER